MKYEVKTKFIFSGSFFVEAESTKQAVEMVEESCGLAIGGNIYSLLPDGTCSWAFDIYPETVIDMVKKVE